MKEKSKAGGNHPRPGQPKKAPTVTLSIRVDKELKEALMRKYKGKLNKMVGEYLRTLTEQ